MLYMEDYSSPNRVTSEVLLRVLRAKVLSLLLDEIKRAKNLR